jgi:hypothetical protein
VGNVPNCAICCRKKHWKDFVEDFNTATLPHIKYYNLLAWTNSEGRKDEAKKRKKAEKKVRGCAQLRRRKISALPDLRCGFAGAQSHDEGGRGKRRDSAAVFAREAVPSVAAFSICGSLQASAQES